METEAGVTQTASLTAIAPASAPKAPDVVVDAKRLSALSATYPAAPLRRGFGKTITVAIGYDVAANGRIINASVQDVSGEAGRYRVKFEEAALKAVNGQNFSPKTVNDEPVVSEGHVRKIKFRTQKQ
ncbi:MAG: hypothetical protein V3U82_07375 [Robiginitomaculum sp.]